MNPLPSRVQEQSQPWLNPVTVDAAGLRRLKIVGTALKLLRERQGLTQREVAENLWDLDAVESVTSIHSYRVYLGLVENGIFRENSPIRGRPAVERVFTPDLIAHLCSIYQITVGDLENLANVELPVAFTEAFYDLGLGDEYHCEAEIIEAEILDVPELDIDENGPLSPLLDALTDAWTQIREASRPPAAASL